MNLRGKKVSIYANAGFIVSVAVLRNIPRGLWKKLLSIEKKQKPETARQMGIAFEYTWHLLWSGANTIPVKKEGRKVFSAPSMNQRAYDLADVCGLFHCGLCMCQNDVTRFKLKPPKLQMT
eukprot:gnl/MRDRNA2_/MRDRNA2_232089_c0_seq1.p1 gnl/MRDRNA2_/MRDRNA2_232089_c0~~gnl/MRDRNA2_/MRDRNA2_232089_c0_seq1.p1  ORF type:complete len:121 (-),score=20.31 gnl/MRDRNA2_/MRDRNA2_232089_c0_seq1:394-756(-)